MAVTIASIAESARERMEALRDLKEIVLGNAVMFGEIPAPTFAEEPRIRFLRDRFNEAGLHNISTDEVGNGVGILPGTKGEQSILVSAHADTVFESAVNHTMAVRPDRIEGPGIGDNSLGLATVASLPIMLDRLGIQFEDDLILAGTVRSLGRGNIEGIRFLVENNTRPLRGGVIVEGAQLGRLSYSSLGMFRGEIAIDVPPEYNWQRFEAAGAIVILNRILTRMLAIPLPREPRTRIIFGSLSSGTAFNTPPTKARLRFEIRSEEPGKVDDVVQTIEDLVDETRAQVDTDVRLERVAQRDIGGIGYTHPLVRCVRQTMVHLGVTAQIAPSTGELGALIQNQIPGLTLGVTRGEHLHEFNESVQIEPMFAGLAQILAALEAIDGGLADE